MIDRTHALPVIRQCQLLKLARSTAYYQPMPVLGTTLALMRRIDARHLAHPFAGAHMLRNLLRRDGHAMGRRHVATLMRRMGLEALYRKPHTSPRPHAHQVYPYLLRDLVPLFQVSHPKSQVQLHKLETAGVSRPKLVDLADPVVGKDVFPNPIQALEIKRSIKQHTDRLEKNPEGGPGNKNNHHKSGVAIQGQSKNTAQQRSQNHQRGKRIGPDVPCICNQAGRAGFPPHS